MSSPRWLDTKVCLELIELNTMLGLVHRLFGVCNSKGPTTALVIELARVVRNIKLRIKLGRSFDFSVAICIWSRVADDDSGIGIEESRERLACAHGKCNNFGDYCGFDT